MQYIHSFSISWCCLVLFLQNVHARVANPQDSLIQRDAIGLQDDETPGFLGKVHDFVLGKRQQICVYDAYLQALDDLRLATDLCGQIIGLPSVTVVVDSTPVITTTKAVTTKYNTVTNIIRNTNTVVVTATASPTAAVQKRSAEPDPEPELALSEARDAALQLLASATAEPSVVESFSSACLCRDIPATATTTITYTELPEVQTVTGDLRIMTTVNTTRVATLTTTTVVEASSSNSAFTPAETVSLPSPTSALPSAYPDFPISNVISCPEANNQTMNVLVGSVRFDGLVICDAAIQDEGDLFRLPYDDVTQCAAACARVNEGFGDTVCRGITFDISADDANPCILKQSARVLTYAADQISLLFTVVAASDNMTSYNRIYNPDDTDSETEVDSAVMSSVFSTSISYVTAPPVVQENSTAFAAAADDSFSSSQGGVGSWSMSSSWYFYYAASWYTLFEATVISSESGAAQTGFAGSGSAEVSVGVGASVTASSASASVVTGAPEVVFSPVTTVFGSSSSMNMSSDASTTIYNGNEITIISGSATTILVAQSTISGAGSFVTGGASTQMNWTGGYGSWGSVIPATGDMSGSASVLPFTNVSQTMNFTAFSASGGGSEATGTEAPRDGTASTDGTMDDNPRTGLQSMSGSTVTAENGTITISPNATTISSIPPGTITSSTNATNMTDTSSSTDGPRSGMQSLPTETSSTAGWSMNVTSILPTAMSTTSPFPTTGFNDTTTSTCDCPTIADIVTVTRTISVIDCRASQCFPFYQAYADWHFAANHEGKSSWDDGLIA